MKTTHTPGPWNFGKQPIDPLQLSSCLHNGFCISAHGHAVAQVNDEENARLIAAAPELLNTLKSIEAALTFNVKCSGIEPFTEQTLHQLRHVRAAIAKAEGNA